ncbi:hypothetical protein DFP72DRAFT_223050 [Ephemerocybe angulata]|uniref:EF-hand domain-containing protein n=1 Tax=Ephemerocybe angulata TaxID=980116 RepID=A0A8H6I5B4_9AGAR|nr:hypothetical protein DFP72DRAFT_223050 [Tulosesus angulatus]
MADELYKRLDAATRRRVDEAFGVEDQIPLERVPETLRRLDLPESEDVLAVFRNAATGWTAGDGSGASEGAAYVSLEDWRSVCAVLLEDDDDDEDGGGGFIAEEDSGEDDGGGFVAEEDSSEDDSGEDSDEFVPGQRRTRTRKTAAASEEASRTTRRAEPGELSARQAQSALDTFALFFPDTPPEDLRKKRIMIKDIQRVAGLLKEKIKPEEIIDMLEMFSNSPDKSVSYDDFVRMLSTANLI